MSLTFVPAPHAFAWRSGTTDRVRDRQAHADGVVEHPRLIAQRIARFAEIVGRERVIPGTDCGFATFAGFGMVDPDVAWMELATLGQGAAEASEPLWSRAARA